MPGKHSVLCAAKISIPFSLQEKYIPGQPKNVDMPRKGETYSSNSKSELDRRESTEAVHSSQEMGAWVLGSQTGLRKFQQVAALLWICVCTNMINSITLPASWGWGCYRNQMRSYKRRPLKSFICHTNVRYFLPNKIFGAFLDRHKKLNEVWKSGTLGGQNLTSAIGHEFRFRGSDPNCGQAPLLSDKY